MNLQELLQRYAEDPRVKTIAEKLNQQTAETLHLTGLVGSADAVIASNVIEQTKKHHVIVLTDKEEAAYFLNDLEHLLEKKSPLWFPDSFKKPGRFNEQHSEHIMLRTETMNRVVNSVTKSEIIVTYPEALFEKVVNKSSLQQHTLVFGIQQKLDAALVTDQLINYGFEQNDFVYEPGQFSWRGGILDVFSFGNELPYRVELFGNDVESIRLFDPVTQLSDKKLSQVSIVPNMHKQFNNEEKSSLLQMLGSNAVLWFKNLQLTIDRLQTMEEDFDELKKNLERITIDGEATDEYNELLAIHFETAKNFSSESEKFHVIEFGKQFKLKTHHQFSFSTKPQISFNKNFDLLISTWKKFQADGFSLLLFSDSKKQVERFYNIFTDLKAGIQFNPIYTSLREGFSDDELKLICYTDHQIFERYHRYQLHQGYSRSKAITLKNLREMKPGDYVTHIDHGVGVFSGLEKISVNGQTQEAVRLIYRDQDILYVSIQSLHKISKYSGKEGTPPRINKLGSDAWEQVKRKTKAKIKDIARDLIKLYASRKSQAGFAFAADSYMQTELEASFIYEDTPDQLKATQDVKRDMERAHPMDRLICGDVGFGKTEVAIRAAAKAVADGKQVAVLVPTTILALQHFKTFGERLKDFPLTVDYINRFKTTKEQTDTKQKLEQGKIDILIGTLSIVSKGVKFKDLGLLIIDEEQKFGVGAKEKLRQMKATVDTLTLTATPIPRTLSFSLMGARDLSIINTAPPNRQPIETVIEVFDADKIKEAIEFEVYRGGQVFFVHNRVQDIQEVAALIQNICPNVDVTVGHGQMEGSKLEEVMLDFIERRSDVLVSTNIVEAGLDIPNANTIIINDAQNFGLSDLHQLRGRVGRSNKKAFCYLLTPPFSSLTQDARKRLQTLEEFSDLGEGFQIAMRDLDIRGAGNLLGAEQSGFIADIGYDTYHKILDEAVQELKHTEFKEVFSDEMKADETFVRDCQIDTDTEMLLPDEYVSSVSERLSLYTQLDKLESEAELNYFLQTLHDRFGTPPPQVEELMDGVRLRNLACRCGFEKLQIKNGVMRCFFISNQQSEYYNSQIFTGIINYIQSHPKRCTLKQTEKNLSITFQAVKTVKQGKDLLQTLSEVAEKVEG